MNTDIPSKQSEKKYGTEYVIGVIIISFLAGCLIMFIVLNDAYGKQTDRTIQDLMFKEQELSQVDNQLRELVVTNETKQGWVDTYCHIGSPEYKQVHKDFCDNVIAHGVNSFNLKTGELLK